MNKLEWGSELTSNQGLRWEDTFHNKLIALVHKIICFASMSSASLGQAGLKNLNVGIEDDKIKC